MTSERNVSSRIQLRKIALSCLEYQNFYPTASIPAPKFRSSNLPFDSGMYSGR